MKLIPELITDVAAESAEKRVNLIAGLRGLLNWAETHPGSPVPDVTAVFPLPDMERGELLCWLDDLGGWLGVPVTVDTETGTLTASRDFDGLIAGADVTLQDGETPASPAEMSEFDKLAAGVLGWNGNTAGGAA